MDTDVLAELRGDLGEHPGLVRDLELQVELALDRVDGSDRLAHQRADRRTPASTHEVLGRVDEVAEHRARGRLTAGTAAVEHELPDGLGLDEDRVERLAHRGERVVQPESSSGGRAPPRPSGPLPRRPAASRCSRGRAPDAMSASVSSLMPSRYTSPATTRAPNAIVAMIAAFAAASNPSTSAVGSRSAYPRLCASASASVNDAPDSDIRVRMKLVVPFTIPMTRWIRSPASDSRSGRISGTPPATDASNKQVDPGALGRLEQLLAHVRQQLLVGRDNGLARLQRLDDQLPGRLDPTDDLDHDVDVRIADDRCAVVREDAGRQGDVTLARQVAHRDLGHLQPDPCVAIRSRRRSP